MNKEVKIDSIGSRIASDYDNLRDQHLTSSSEIQNQRLSEFKKIKNQVDSWYTFKVEVKYTRALTQSQRTSFQKIY